MTARKLSISVSPEVEETIKAAAEEEGKPVSAWLAEAAVEKARLAALHAAGRAAARELVAEYESEHGALPEQSRRRAQEFLMEAGLLDDECSRAATFAPTTSMSAVPPGSRAASPEPLMWWTRSWSRPPSDTRRPW
ncbi:DUF1778 domain-containing protein [Microbispora sp. GKU 823]|uniref:type II toxin -antitoxin system TacA 1-like antitoxin n=1 Tax=Microbispora sp. GKU 823 TaxID=1652100 RepID=UPI00117D0FDC|nr:DUF1778 domain-containing protein [Microbispora sp. GKU 823]